MENPPTLDQFYSNLVIFLEESKSDYVIIGGLAVSVIGEPRMTHDIDPILSIQKKRIKLVDQKAYFPTPEDLIILKIMVGRDKDMLDAKSIVIRHKNIVHRLYLE